MQEFTLATVVAAPYEETVERTRTLLAEAGFGVLTEIDIAATLRAKLGIDVPRELILGACRPQLAHRALGVDPRLAVLLPCNVVVTEIGDATTRVEVLDPALMTSFGDAPALADVVGDARTRLTTMLAALDDTKEKIDAARS